MAYESEWMQSVERNLALVAERQARADAILDRANATLDKTNASLEKTNASLDKTNASLEQMKVKTEAALEEMRVRQRYHDEALERHDARMREIDERIKQVVLMIAENNQAIRSLLSVAQLHQRRLDLLEG